MFQQQCTWLEYQEPLPTQGKGGTAQGLVIGLGTVPLLHRLRQTLDANIAYCSEVVFGLSFSISSLPPSLFAVGRLQISQAAADDGMNTALIMACRVLR